ncbi:MAG: sel1 repeat family protein, partial [Candidatus Methanomethylophilaceae archaeon]|nr:sel1 repeat family protein [Candidatus Methanomethylophilaceae archaeon]
IGDETSISEMISVARKLSENGDPRAAGTLGRAYYYGKGVPRDLDKAKTYLETAAGAGFKWASKELSSLQSEITGLISRKPEMRELWKSRRYDELFELSSCLFSLGDKEAAEYLGRLYRDGKGTGPDLEKSKEMLRSAADSGIMRAQNELLEILWENSEYEEFVSLSQSYSDSNPAAKGRLGRAYKTGNGVSRNLSKAEILLRDAYEDGVKWAGSELTEVLWKQEKYDEAAATALPLAEEGDARACGYLGRMLMDGKGIEKDLEKSEYYLSKAAESGIKRASRDLETVKSLLKEKKSESKKLQSLWKSGKINELASLSQELAETGDQEAMGYLGRIYRDGGNPESAGKWYKMSADSGVKWAQTELVDMLADSRRFDEAFVLAEKYSDANPACAGRLARFCRDGKGTGKDLGRAESLYREAVSGGVKLARGELVEVLWNLGKYEEMVSLAVPLLAEDDVRALGYMGLAYRDGKGVSEDPEKALELLEKASEKNKKWKKEMGKP